jgi:hypothetical protein
MKILITFLILVFTINNLNAQVNKTLVKSLAVETTTSYTSKVIVMLPGKVDIKEWNKSFIRITTNIMVKNMSENIVKRLVIVGRYTLEVKEDKYGKMMIIKMPNVVHYVAVQGVGLIETYTFEVNAPEGYKVVVKQDLNPNITNSMVKQLM